MTRSRRAVFWLLVPVLALWAGAAPVRAGTADRATATYHWKMATLAPRGVAWGRMVEQVLFPAIDEASGGDVYVKVFWGGVLGGDEEVIDKTREGLLQGCGVGGQGAAYACPEFAVVELPFLFRNYEEVDHVKKAMTGAFAPYFEENGLVLLFWADQDFDQIYSTKWEPVTLEDLRRARFATWFGPVEEALFHSLGIEPLPVKVPDSIELVRSGRADAMIAPAAWMVGAQMHAVVKYVNEMRIRYAPAPILASKRAWYSLPEAYRKRLMDRRDELTLEICEGVRRDSERSLESMLQYGVRRVKTPPAELERIRAASVEVWRGLSGIMYPEELLDELTGRLDAFRAREKGNE